MATPEWLSKDEVSKLLGVSPKTVQRRLSDLDPRHVRRGANAVHVSTDAIRQGLLGETVAQLEEKLELSERTMLALSDHVDDLQREAENKRLEALVAEQARELESLRERLTTANRQVEALGESLRQAASAFVPPS